MRTVVIAFALLAGCGGKKEESAHMKRARELLSIGEWSNARTELKLELKDSPKQNEARGLLLYCLDRGEGFKAGFVEHLTDLYAVVNAVTDPKWQNASQDTRDFGNKTLISARQNLYDQGVDTSDPTDLREVIKVASRFGFEKDDDADRKDGYAAILAGVGDAKAAQYLVERLKTQKPEKVVEHLIEVGEPAAPLLKKAVADKSFIGRAAALDALAHIEAADAAVAFGAANKEYKLPQDDASDVPGVSDLGPTFVSASWRRDVRAHVQYARLDGNSTTDGVLVVQSWNPAAKAMVVDAYAFRDGDMKKMRVTKDGTAFALGGASAVFGVEPSGQKLVLRRVQRQTTSEEVETGSVRKPTVGMAVKLKGYAPHGKIIRADETGLWVVRVDQPIDGMNELTVADSALIGLQMEPRVQTTTETLTAALASDGLAIEKLDYQRKERPAMTKFREFTADMCRCTTSACATRVSDEMTEWSKQAARDAKNEPKMSDEETKEAGRIGEQMGQCMRRAMSGN